MQPGQRRDPGAARLWHIGAALAVSFTMAVAGLAALAWLAWAMLHHPRLPQPGVMSLHDAVGVLQLVFASVAGAGALVALVVAYRRQKVAEADSAHDRARVFNERFTAIAAHLGDVQAAVRLAGVYAMAGLADDWQASRQTCIDVLCAYLRMPYEPAPPDDASVENPGDDLEIAASEHHARPTQTKALTCIFDKVHRSAAFQGLIRDEEAAGSCEVCPGKTLRECATCSLPLCRDVTSATLHERDMPQNAARTCGQRAVKRS